jgi:PAS domain S-box-containing protein
MKKSSSESVVLHTEPQDYAALRQRAEEKCRFDEETVLETLTLADARQVLHELRVHQIELEMQNEQLRHAQIEMEAVRSRYFNLYDLAPVGYLTFSSEGKVLEGNLAAATMLRVPRRTLVKRTITSFICKEDQDIYYLHRKKCFESSDPQVWEMRMVRTDGSMFWANLQATPAQGGEYWIIFSDISARKQAEAEKVALQKMLDKRTAELQKSEERFRSFVENANDVLFTLTPKGCFSYVSPQRYAAFGYTLSETIGQHFQHFIHPDDIPGYQAFHQELLDISVHKSGIEYRMLCKDGRCRWYGANASLVKNPADGTLTIVGIGRDITEQRQAEEVLMENELRFFSLMENSPNVAVKGEG